jgi:hypothetical protein
MTPCFSSRKRATLSDSTPPTSKATTGASPGSPAEYSVTADNSRRPVISCDVSAASIRPISSRPTACTCATPALNPAMPTPFNVPASNASGSHRGWVLEAELPPDPPTIRGVSRTPRPMTSPPIPGGPSNALCPAKTTTSPSPHAIAWCPAACAQSNTRTTSGRWTSSRRMSSIGWRRPVTFEQTLRTMAARYRRRVDRADDKALACAHEDRGVTSEVACSFVPRPEHLLNDCVFAEVTQKRFVR